VTLVGTSTTRLLSVVTALTRQNSRCDWVTLPLVVLAMRRTMSRFAGRLLMSGTVTEPVVCTCDTKVPSSETAGPHTGVKASGWVPQTFGGTGVSNGSSRQVTKPLAAISGSKLGRPQLPSLHTANEPAPSPVAQARSSSCSLVGSTLPMASP